REHWQRGERTPAEKYLQRFPALEAEPESAFAVVCGEFRLRQELGEAPNLEEYAQRFPLHADRLRQQTGQQLVALAALATVPAVTQERPVADSSSLPARPTAVAS